MHLLAPAPRVRLGDPAGAALGRRVRLPPSLRHSPPSSRRCPLGLPEAVRNRPPPRPVDLAHARRGPGGAADASSRRARLRSVPPAIRKRSPRVRPSLGRPHRTTRVERLLDATRRRTRRGRGYSGAKRPSTTWSLTSRCSPRPATSSARRAVARRARGRSPRAADAQPPGAVGARPTAAGSSLTAKQVRRSPVGPGGAPWSLRADAPSARRRSTPSCRASLRHAHKSAARRGPARQCSTRPH